MRSIPLISRFHLGKRLGYFFHRSFGLLKFLQGGFLHRNFLSFEKFPEFSKVGDYLVTEIGWKSPELGQIEIFLQVVS